MKGKKLLTILLCVMLIGTLLPAGVFASENVEVDTASTVSAEEDESQKALVQTEGKIVEEHAPEVIKTEPEQSDDKKTDPDETNSVVLEDKSNESGEEDSGSNVPKQEKDDKDSATVKEPEAEPAADSGITPSKEMLEEAEKVTVCTVTFDANGHGIAPAAVTAEKDTAISEPTAPSENGYSFTGWYKYADATVQWDFAKDKVTEDITLYAGWSEEPPAVMREAGAKSAGTYAIEYVDRSDWFVGYPPDGDYMTGNWPSNTTAAAGTVVSLPSIISGPHAVEKPFGEGYVIYTWEWMDVLPRGWTNSATDNILDKSSGTFVMPESDVIVTGRWVYNESIQIFPYATDGGRVTWDGVNASYAQGSYATLTAVPDKGYYFVGWKLGDENGPTGEVVSTNNPWRFQVTWDKRYTRYYAIFAVRPPGKIRVLNGKADKYTGVEGDIITVTADDPPAGDEFTFRVFDKWTADSPAVHFADASASVTTFEMPGPDVTVMASYAAACDIMVETDPAGFEEYTSGGGIYRVGDTVTVTASTPDGYRFVAWNGSHGNTYNSTYSFTAWKTRYVIACYEKIPTITVQESEGGTATADSTYIDAGKTVTLTARPKGGYTFDHWEVVSGGVELDNASAAKTTFVANGNDVVIKPHFTKLDVVVTLQQVTYKVVGGTWSDGTKEDKTEWVLSGFKPTDVPTGMIAGEGYTGGAWDIDPNDATITGATTFTYTFEAVPIYTVTYKVVNGTWADRTSTDKTEEVAAGQSPKNIPEGMIAAENYEDGAWDNEPSGAIISGDTTYTYTFKPALMDIAGIVEWNDGDDEQSKRPESIKVHLKANDTELESQNVEESEYGIWTFSFDSLPALDSQGVIDYAITVDEIPEYTTKVEKEGSYVFRIINTLNSDSDKPGYTVTFDANVPANASTTCTGSMDDQSFTYYEKKALSENGYFLPGYDFDGWNTKADGTGTAYSGEESVESLSDDGGAVTLYAQWKAKAYTIVFKPGEIGGDDHVQTAYFDQQGTLETYSDEGFGWGSGGRTLRGWTGTGFETFYSDGASFVNLCGEPRSNGNLADRELVAQWVETGQIVATVTKDGVPQEGLADCFKLVNKDGIEFSVPLTYGDGKYTFDTSRASQPGHGPEQLPEGEYDVIFGYTENGTTRYPKTSAKITYEADSASNVVFNYYTFAVNSDPVYVHLNYWCGGDFGIEPYGAYVALDGSTVTMRITYLDPNYIFDRYTVDGVAPIWEDGDLTKPEQTFRIRGKTTVIANVVPRPTLTITPLQQTFTYNGQTQGEDDTAYEDPAEIAEKVSVEGLREGDSLASLVLDGQGDSVGDYDLIASNVKVVNAAGNDVTGNYDINYQPGTLTIETARVTITVDSASKAERDSDPVFNGTVEGLFDEGDLGEIKFVRAGSDEAAGTYTDVLTATYTENENYEVTVIPGDFTIEASDPVPAKTGTLTFDLSGGTLDGKTGSITIEANVGDTIKLPGAPTREGYTFQYWKGSRYEAGADYKVEGDHTFTAVWAKDKSSSSDSNSPASPRNGKSAAKTGDESNVGLYLMLMSVSLLGLVLSRKKAIRKK